MPKISVVIITFNEEKNIKRCLNSVGEIADEIVVVDSFSSDGTKKICQEYKVKFLENTFEGHIEQKNFAIRHASYPHILSLDADEAVSEELKASILEVKENWNHDGYYFNRLTNYCGKWIYYCDWYPDRKLRLWDSRKGSWQGVNPHDKFLMQDGSTTKFLKGNLLHYSFYTIDQHMEQINKFSSIRAREMFKAGRKTNSFYIYFSPLFKFIKSYVIKLGFLDGFYGYVICRNSAHSNFLKYAKLKVLNQSRKES